MAKVLSRRERIRARNASDDDLVFDPVDPTPHEIVVEEETTLDVMRASMLAEMAPWIEKLEARLEAGADPDELARELEEFDREFDALEEDVRPSIYQLVDAASQEEREEMQRALDAAPAPTEEAAPAGVPASEERSDEPAAAGGE